MCPPRPWPLAALATLAFVAACGSDPVDAAGDYSLALTNRDNGCEFANWMVGNTASNVAFTITQDGDAATGTVGGLAGGFLDVALGDHVFSGPIDGNDLDLTLYGSRATSSGNCTYTINAEISAQLDGDVLTGAIDYRSATNGNPDCGAIEGCVSRQDFNGTRPPR
jgi:hypothetical protein